MRHLLLPSAFQRVFAYYLLPLPNGFPFAFSDRNLISCCVVDFWTVYLYYLCGSIGLIPSEITQGSKINLPIVGKEILGILGERTKLCIIE